MLDCTQLSNIRPIRHRNFRDLENFADVLDLAILNLKQNGKESELGDGYIYQYQRWLSDHKKQGLALTLRDFIIQEAE